MSALRRRGPAALCRPEVGVPSRQRHPGSCVMRLLRPSRPRAGRSPAFQAVPASEMRQAVTPILRNSRKPDTSVAVVTKTEDASAGSTLSQRRVSGISVPTIAATTMVPIMASASARPIRGSPFQTQETPAIRRPIIRPLAEPTASSLRSACRLFFQLSSRARSRAPSR